MQVVILAGGLGTRLDPSGTGTPKALREVNGMSILEWQIRNIREPGSNILLLIGEEDNLKHFQDVVPMLSQQYGYQIEIGIEEKRMGTLGALITAKDSLEKEFIVLLGDILSDFPPVKCLSALKKRKLEFIAVSRLTEHPEDSDVFEIDKTGNIASFSHYPHSRKLSENVHLGLTGIFACQRRFLDRFPKNEFIDIWESLAVDYREAKEIGLLYTYNKFKDVGTTKRLSEALKFAEQLNFLEDGRLYLVDRDNTLISDPARSSSRRFIPNEGLINELGKIKVTQPDAKICVITNQPAIAKNQITIEQTRVENENLVSYLNSKSLTIDALEFCPHHPEVGHPGELKEFKVKCFCRKPLPGMAIKIIGDLNIRPRKISVYGDSAFDYFLARNLDAEFRWVFMRNSIDRFRATAMFSLALAILRQVGPSETLGFIFANCSGYLAKRRWARIDHL